jgi:hypothetical protein
MIALLLLAAATPANVPSDLASAVKRYDEAQIHGSRAELERWLADDYLLVNSTGALETKAQLIADYTAPGFTLEPFTIEQPVHKWWRDGAVMGGVATLRGMDGGKRYEVRLRFADIWAKRNGQWRVIYTQVSKAK